MEIGASARAIGVPDFGQAFFRANFLKECAG